MEQTIAPSGAGTLRVPLACLLPPSASPSAQLTAGAHLNRIKLNLIEINLI